MSDKFKYLADIVKSRGVTMTNCFRDTYLCNVISHLLNLEMIVHGYFSVRLYMQGHLVIIYY